MTQLPTALENELGVTNWKSRLLGVGLAAGGIALTVLASTASGLLQTVLAAVGSTFISLGSVSIFFNVALRRNVQREMMRLVGLNGELVSSKVISAKEARNMDWKSILAGRSNYQILLVDPLQWVNNYFYLILDSAREKKIEVNVLIPDPQGPVRNRLATFYDRAMGAVEASLEEAATKIESDWNARKGANALARGSELHLKLMPDMPNYGVIVADGIAVVVFDGSIEKSDFDGPFAAVFAGSRIEYPIRWFVEQVEKARGCPRKFDNKVE